MTDSPTAGPPNAGLGAVQQTLFIPLAARARETRRRHPALRDPKAIEILASVDYDAATYGTGWGGFVTVPRTLIFDHWVREFLARHAGGTVVELGTGLNTRFERTDNGTVRWIDLDLPDTIALRRRFFADTVLTRPCSPGQPAPTDLPAGPGRPPGRRHMIEGSVTGEDWLEAVAELPGPYFFVSEGVFVYLEEDDVTRTLTRIAGRFPGALIAFDTYPRRMLQMQHQQAARKGMPARWAWACDDPRTLERYGLRLTESATITRPPSVVRRNLPARYRYLLPLADPLLGKSFALSLFRAGGG
jgi:O-methyltransferase involved in polyketide biosynthesis